MKITRMIMQDMPDKELDDLFRTAVDNVQYEFKQEAWQNLQNKMYFSRWKRWGMYLGSALLLLAGGVFIFYQIPDKPVVLTEKTEVYNLPHNIQNKLRNQRKIVANNQTFSNHQKKDQSKSITKTPVVELPAKSTKKSSANVISNLPRVNSNDATHKQKSSILTTPTEKTLPGQTVPNKVNAQSKSTKVKNVNPSLLVSPNKNPGYTYNDIFKPLTKAKLDSKEKSNANGSFKGVKKTSKGIKVYNSSEDIKKNSKGIKASNPSKGVRKNSKGIKSTVANPMVTASKPKLAEVAVLTAKKPYEQVTQTPPALVLEKAVLPANAPAMAQHPRRKFSVIVQVSPDLSMVNNVSVKHTRLGVGLLAEYELLKNFSITGGAHYSSKAYEANAESYTPQDGRWKWQDSPESINATCRVLEVPINLRYYFHNQPKHRLFVSSGISSYWMLNESYRFEYPSRPQWNYGWGVSNQNQHYMGIANFSIGWQKTLNKRWSIQAEPFLKVPLGGVGEGNVRLTTTGILFGLKYNLF